MSKFLPTKCCLCGDVINGFGHNPDPVKQYPERCCEACNASIVIPARIGVWKKNEKNNS